MVLTRPLDDFLPCLLFFDTTLLLPEDLDVLDNLEDDDLEMRLFFVVFARLLLLS